MLLNASSKRAGPRFRHFVPGSSFLAFFVLGFLFLGVAGIESPGRSRQSEAV